MGQVCGKTSETTSTEKPAMNEPIMAGRSSDPTDNLKKKPSKGILKSSSSFEVEDGPSVSRKDKGHTKGTKWDEMNIIETLHPVGKDYGHMKIEEPKTPYERSLTEIDGVDPQDLAKKLETSANAPLKSLARLEERDSDEDELTPEEKEKKRVFESKRKAHYNEFLAAKKALKEMSQEDEDDEDEEDNSQQPSTSVKAPPPPKKGARKS